MEQMTHEFKIDKNLYFKWIQLVHEIPNHWKKKLTENTINSQNLSYLNHHLIKVIKYILLRSLPRRSLI